MDFRKDLVENILPFWLENAIDYENGGIYTCLDREGNIYGTDKSVWFQDSHVGCVPSGKQKCPNIPSKKGLSKYEKFTKAD